MLSGRSLQNGCSPEGLGVFGLNWSLVSECRTIPEQIGGAGYEAWAYSRVPCYAVQAPRIGWAPSRVDSSPALRSREAQPIVLMIELFGTRLLVCLLLAGHMPDRGSGAESLTRGWFGNKFTPVTYRAPFASFLSSSSTLCRAPQPPQRRQSRPRPRARVSLSAPWA